MPTTSTSHPAPDGFTRRGVLAASAWAAPAIAVAVATPLAAASVLEDGLTLVTGGTGIRGGYFPVSVRAVAGGAPVAGLTVTFATPWLNAMFVAPGTGALSNTQVAVTGSNGVATLYMRVRGEFSPVSFSAWADDFDPMTWPIDLATTEVTLDWRVKDDLLALLTTPEAAGVIQVDQGAARNPDGSFRFTSGAGNRSTVMTYQGRAHLQAYPVGSDYAFDLTLSNVRVDYSTRHIVLDITARPYTDPATVNPFITTTNVQFVDFNDAGGSSTSLDGYTFYQDIFPILSTAGSTAIGGLYAAGEQLDRLDFTAFNA